MSQPVTIAFSPTPRPSQGGRRGHASAGDIVLHHRASEFARGTRVPQAVTRQLDRPRTVRLMGAGISLECSENTLDIFSHGQEYVMAMRSGTQSFTLVSGPEQATLITHEGAWSYSGKVAQHLFIYVSRAHMVAERTREEHAALLRRSQQQLGSLAHKLSRATEVRTRKARASSSGPTADLHDAPTRQARRTQVSHMRQAQALQEDVETDTQISGLEGLVGGMNLNTGVALG